MNLENILIHVTLRYFWLLLMIITSLTGLVWWRRGQRHIHANPLLKAGYKKLIRNFVLFGNIPWVFMGLAMITGDVPTVTHFFNLKNGSVVVSWYVTLIVWWLLGAYWIFFRGGAELLAEHPGLFNFPVSDKLIKVLFLVGLVVGVAAVLAVTF